jgi:antitoxin ParD1/3/4
VGQIETVTVGLPIDVAEAVNAAVASGEFTSVEDAIVQAVRDWKAGRSASAIEDAELLKLWTDGVESGPGRFASFDKLVEEAEQRVGSKR